jgi:tetratricopeptide (TPR) repeat protein
MASVFLSYDHEDAALAKPLVQALEKAGHTVWFDRQIHGGAQYSRKIEQALDEADAVVVLWSPRSLESAWVRDEAAEGRDRGKLVPLSVGGVTPPMGFRQFQTIDLGAWKGRGRVPKSKELLNAVESQAGLPGPGQPRSPPPPAAAPALQTAPRRRWLMPVAALALLAIVAAGAWAWLGRGGLPVVEVAAANSSPRSQAAASDLFVKLGSLAQIGEGKWQLVDAASARARPFLVFRTADTGSPARPHANLVLLDGKDDSLLWSREFSAPAGGEADLRQQLSFTAGRVLGCALETREAGGLPRDLLKRFLNTCALLAEASIEDPAKVLQPLRAIVAAKPGFTPAWGRLLIAASMAVDVAEFSGGDFAGATRQLRKDMAEARRVAPDLPELTAAELRFLPPTDYGRSLALLEKAAEKAPENAEISYSLSGALQRVGRMYEAVLASRRAAAFDPLSPAAAANLIMALAYSGQLDEARRELARAERLWAGTGALRDAQWGFHLRFGDPKIAKQYANFSAPGLDMYFNARADPSPGNVARLVEHMRQSQRQPDRGWFAFAIQALGEFNHTDDILSWVDRTPTDQIASDAYVLFRPALAGFRRDPRFMALAKRIGLTDYWRSSGKWPDFCNTHDLRYDCKAEAAKYG